MVFVLCFYPPPRLREGRGWGGPESWFRVLVPSPGSESWDRVLNPGCFFEKMSLGGGGGQGVPRHPGSLAPPLKPPKTY